MRTFILVLATLCVVSCGNPGSGEGDPASPADASKAASRERGGTITVGGETWTIVPSISCSVYPGGIVNIAGHAAENPELEVVIDWGEPNQARIAESDSEPGWHAIRDTLEIRVDGSKVTGHATFSEFSGGTGKRAEGSFQVGC